MISPKRFGIVLKVWPLLLAGSLLLSACAGAPTPQATTTPGPAATLPPTLAPTAAPTAGATAAPTGLPAPQYTLDSTGLAASITTELVPAVSANDSSSPWEVLPAYTRLTLAGYPIPNSFLKPQIFIYPVEALAATNPGAAQSVASLRMLIKSPREITIMPFMPLVNAQQLFHANIQYLGFKDGQGLRYVTQFDQAPLPINNYELIYTFQGLTNDGKYYVAAVLPVNHPSLPPDQKLTGKEPPEFTSDYPKYLANVAAALNTQAANTFTPDLTRLDAMMSSLEIK